MNQIKSEKAFADKPEIVKSLLDEIIEETTLQMAEKAKAAEKARQGGLFGVGALDAEQQAYPVTSPCPATFGAAQPQISYPVTYPCPATFGALQAA
jgi:septal ring factor EnvC (AmiA/AmiB activator)